MPVLDSHFWVGSIAMYRDVLEIIGLLYPYE